MLEPCHVDVDPHVFSLWAPSQLSSDTWCCSADVPIRGKARKKTDRGHSRKELTVASKGDATGRHADPIGSSCDRPRVVRVVWGLNCSRIEMDLQYPLTLMKAKKKKYADIIYARNRRGSA